MISRKEFKVDITGDAWKVRTAKGEINKPFIYLLLFLRARDYPILFLLQSFRLSLLPIRRSFEPPSYIPLSNIIYVPVYTNSRVLDGMLIIAHFPTISTFISYFRS